MCTGLKWHTLKIFESNSRTILRISLIINLQTLFLPLKKKSYQFEYDS